MTDPQRLAERVKGLEVGAAPNPIGPPYDRRPDGRPPVGLAQRDGFWGRITGGAQPTYAFIRLKGDASTEVEGATGIAKEVNEVFDVAEGSVVWLVPDTTTSSPTTYLFNVSEKLMEPPNSWWDVVTGNANAPEYNLDGFVADEANGVTDIPVGTWVRVFVTRQAGETFFRFEYDSGVQPAWMENSFDFIEIWPALVVTAADPIVCRVWIPGSTFPPVTNDHYELEPAEGAVNVAFDKVGDGTFAGKTLVPCLRDQGDGIADWIQVRCQLGAFVAADADTPLPPNGAIVVFHGTLPSQPLPYTVTVEYEVAFDVVEEQKVNRRWKRMYCSREVNAADDFKVTLEGPDAGWVKFRTGEWRLELSDPPPAGAEIRVRYVPVPDCKWSWVEIPHTVDGTWLEVDLATGKLNHIGPGAHCFGWLAPESPCGASYDETGHMRWLNIDGACIGPCA